MPLKIVACVKLSLDVSEIKVDPSTKRLHFEGVPKRLGDIDYCVLEEARRLKESQGGTVHLLTYGPKETKEGLKEAMAMGVDDVKIIEDTTGKEQNPAVTAEILARAVEKLGGVDVILCGEASDDGFSFQVGPRLAERLRIPQVTYARNLTVENGLLRAERTLETETESVQVSLPALVSVTEESNKPRRPTMLEVLKARSKSVDFWQIERDLRLSRDQMEALCPLEKVGVEGIVVARKQVLIKGRSASEASSQLLNYLFAENVIGGPQ